MPSTEDGSRKGYDYAHQWVRDNPEDHAFLEWLAEVDPRHKDEIWFSSDLLEAYCHTLDPTDRLAVDDHLDLMDLEGEDWPTDDFLMDFLEGAQAAIQGIRTASLAPAIAAPSTPAEPA